MSVCWIQMISPLIICTVSLLCTAGEALTTVVQQTPGLLVERGHSAQMDCSHSMNWYDMYWFQQLPGESMKVIVHTVPFKQPDFGNFSQDKYSANKTVAKSGSFTVKHVEPGDNGVYFCFVTERNKEKPVGGKERHNEQREFRFLCHASSLWNSNPDWVGNEPVFGYGTKLTVLDSNRSITPPTVTVLRPSQNECRNNKDEKRRKTLVCVASRFYPDHVSVFWQIDAVNVETDGVATDNAALWEGEHYSITSRLRVPLREWFTPGKKFTCTVSFFNGNETVHRSDWVEGVEGPGAGAIREKYLRITHTAKLSYVVLIFKSSVFGVFVVFLAWRLQSRLENSGTES
ncbi:M1-specific T cell receptor beta chain-like [Sebastes umbrosus]|uniref:M1-specific T cell receptor beta chain-like n=1 Tax=Sebastes umbrosus TaxID=72105 RepID=UPI00189E3479|nr:M1-specific T cell receptor beta chain-like [Sebastes umbrosus]